MLRPRSIAKHIALKIPPVKRVATNQQSLRKNVEDLEAEKIKIIEDTRYGLSLKFLRGEGVEIGALHMPLPLPPHAKAKYVDYISVSELRELYPELKDLALVNVDIVDDGERLSKVKNSSVDFIIANHMLEHCQDPVGTILNFYKKLKPGGIMFMAIPDMRYTFDMHRPLTPYSHLLEEHRVYPAKKYYIEHTREIVKLTEGLKDKKAIEARVKELADIKYSIHYHVWTQQEMVDLFYKTREKFSLKLEIQAMINNVHEVVFVVQKLDPTAENAKTKAITKHYFGYKKAK